MNLTCAVTTKDVYGAFDTFVPAGYTKTSFNLPAHGETFLSPKGEVCTLKTGDVLPSGPRVILQRDFIRKPLYLRDVYGTDKPIIPPGFVSTNLFRIPQQSDIFLNKHGVVVEWAVGPFYSEPRLLLRRIRPTDVYRSHVPTPTGFTLGEFGKVILGKKYLSTFGGHFTAAQENSQCTDLYRYELLPKIEKKKRWLLEVEAYNNPLPLGGRIYTSDNLLGANDEEYTILSVTEKL